MGRDATKRGRIESVVALLVLLGAALAAVWLAVPPRAATPSSPSPSPSATRPSFIFGAVGDFDGAGDADMLGLARRLNATNGEVLLALGDLGYTSDEQGWCNSIKSAFNNVTIIVGNHDTSESGPGDIAQFASYCPFVLLSTVVAGPSTPGYGYEYYFDYPAVNPLARFIMISAGVTGVLNYDFGVGSTHYNWVVTAVNDARTRGIPWVVAGMHKMCITVGTKSSCQMGQSIFDKLVDLKVDLILQGHDHAYERSKQLALGPACTTVPSGGGFDADCIVDDGSDDHYVKGAGPVVVVNGAGGRDLYTVSIGGGDAEIGYFVEVMGSNTNTQGRPSGAGTVLYTVNATEISARTDFCPLGSTGSDGQCPAQQSTVFRDQFTIGGMSPPPPVPVAIPVGAFRGQYYDNQDLTALRVERVDSAINFDWGTGSPDPSVAADSFGVRWEGYWDFPDPGIYRFTSRTDDGMRIWIDNVSLLNAWAPQSPMTYVNDTELTSGRHYIKVEYFEQTGTAVAQVSWSYVGPPSMPVPNARISPMASYARPNATVTFDATSSTPSQPGAILEARWDWEDDGTWDTTWSSTLTAQHAYPSAGTYTVRLEVRDSLGMTDNETASVLVDGTAPVTSATLAGTVGSNGWYRSSVTVTLTASDAGSGVATLEYRIDGGAWQAYITPISLSEGRHTAEYRGTDVAGVVSAVGSQAVNVDSTPPRFQQISPGGVVVTSEVVVTWIAEDSLSGIVEYAVSVDGGPFVDNGVTPVFRTTLSDGPHSVTVKAVDEAGNFAVEAVTFRVDTGFFSPTGPYSGVPLYLLLELGFALGAFALLRQRRRRKERVWESRARRRGVPDPQGARDRSSAQGAASRRRT